MDVGQLTDHTVLTTLRPEGDGWLVDGIYQLPLHIPYSRQLRLLRSHLDDITHLAVDAGGSGQGLPEHIHGPTVVPMVITGGTGKGNHVNDRITVGKTYLIQGMMQQVYYKELRVDPHAPGADLLKAEMQAFRYMPNGRFRKMEAKAGQHDDAVMSLAIACWLARRV